MISRRQFVGASVAGAALLPQIASASQNFIPEDRFLPQVVRVKKEFKPGTIVIWPDGRYLYLITDTREAIRYGVSVGKEGLGFYGSGVIERKVKWPSWRPTAAMIEREPKYRKWENGMPGGPNNPLGARALYLFKDGRDTMIRIHGTTQPWSIGRAASNGCFRMINDHVVDLFDRVPLGTEVYTI